MLIVPAKAVALCKQYEGFARVVKRTPVLMAGPYVCPAGYWTIGYGHLCTAEHPLIDEEQGEEYLARDLESALYAVVRLCPGITSEPDRRLAALVSFTFNLGASRLKASTLRVRVNARNWREAEREINRWVWGGGRKLPGLVLRRQDEGRMLR